eukprot:1196349-Prorocentrum_minimum.AAC.7
MSFSTSIGSSGAVGAAHHSHVGVEARRRLPQIVLRHQFTQLIQLHLEHVAQLFRDLRGFDYRARQPLQPGHAPHCQRVRVGSGDADLDGVQSLACVNQDVPAVRGDARLQRPARSRGHLAQGDFHVDGDDARACFVAHPHQVEGVVVEARLVCVAKLVPASDLQRVRVARLQLRQHQTDPS